MGDLCQEDARPVIYGENLCYAIHDKKIVLTGGLIEKFVYMFSSKTVLHAKYNTYKRIVLKTLVPKKHFKDVEAQFNSVFTDKVLLSKNSIDLVKLHTSSSIKIRPPSKVRHKIRLCPQSANIDNFYRRIGGSEFNLQDYLHVWTIVKTNPEPLILKMLSPPKWPVPLLYGSCGRVIVVEDCGLMLSQFYEAPWLIRANISYQLIESALKFTFSDPDFGFYLTDMSPDNIAVSLKGKVKFIDLEDVILVDKNPRIADLPVKEWEHNHTSKHFDCKDCFVFESDEVCRYHSSDHNIYALCKEIFAHTSIFPGGFLHSHLSGITSLDELNHLIEDCLTARYKPRLVTAQKIMSLLKFYL